MRKRYGWLLMLVVAAMLVAACGPGEASPTPSEEPQAPATKAPDVATNVPVAEGDWHVLGSADAAVTIVEYTDFQ